MQYFAFFFLMLMGNIPAIVMAYLCRKRFRGIKILAYLWICLFSVLQTGFFVDEVSGWKKQRLFNSIQQDFAFHFQGLDTEKQLFTLSLLAEKMRNEPITTAQKTEIAHFMQEMATQINLEIAQDTHLWKNNALYLSQLAIFFAAYHDIIPTDTTYNTLHARIIYFLVEEMNHNPIHQLCSYPEYPEPWLCDNAGVLYAIALYDAQYKTNYHINLLVKWQNSIKTDFTDPKTGLPCTQVSTEKKCFVPTRASSTAWLIAYLSLISKEEGKKAWDLYKQHFHCSFAGIGAAFYEYVDDTKTVDYDSGTLVCGLGTIASGLSIRTASINEDWLTYFQLTNTLRVVSVASFFFPEMENDVLIKAILYNSAI